MEKKKSRKNNTTIFAAAAVLILAGLLAYYFLYANKSPQKTTPSLPAYALLSPQIIEAYLFAADNPEALNGVNCYCGCMQGLADDRLHYRGLIDCYTELNGSFDPHASGCPTCINEALRIKSLVARGKAKDEIKAAIDAEYGHPISGSGCGIVPNSTDAGAIFVSPGQGMTGGCAAATTTTL